MNTMFSLKMALALITLSATLQVHAALKTCEEEIKETNTFLTGQGAVPVNDITDLATTLRTIKNFGHLPDRYITTEEAKRLGWSGKDSESLWGLKPTNKKWVGGDRYSHPSLPTPQTWLSADIDVAKGHRSPKHVIYSFSGQQRYITTNNYQHLVELAPCQ